MYKIFQPFFITILIAINTTGQGTGLQLGMCDDIVSKSHGGELTVETIENEDVVSEHAGTTFIISLPTNNN